MLNLIIYQQQLFFELCKLLMYIKTLFKYAKFIFYLSKQFCIYLLEICFYIK